MEQEYQKLSLLQIDIIEKDWKKQKKKKDEKNNSTIDLTVLYNKNNIIKLINIMKKYSLPLFGKTTWCKKNNK